MILDSSDFIGSLTIAQLGQPQVEDGLNEAIEEYESKFLKEALGSELSKSFVEGIDVGSDEELLEKWDNILNGVEFTYYGVSTKYEGIRKDLARYVYWHYQRDLNNQQTGVGVVKVRGQGSTKVSPMFKMIDAWNEMVDSLKLLWMYLRSNQETYGSFYMGDRSLWYNEHQNQFGV